MTVERRGRGRGGAIGRLAAFADTTAEIGAQEVTRPWAETYVAVGLAVVIAHFSNGAATTLAGGASALLAAVGIDAVRRAGDRDLRPGAEILLGALVAVGIAGASRLVPTGIGLLLVIGVGCVAMRAVVEWELRLREMPGGASHRDRIAARAVATFLLFGASLGVVALVPGIVTVPDTPSARPDAVGPLAILAVSLGSAAIAALLAARMASLRRERFGAAVRDALGAGLLNGVASSAFAAFGVARLAGPAGLAVIFYARELWAATPEGERGDWRLLLEIFVLIGATAITLLWIGVGR
jgi:hypothetical protein